MIIIVKLVIKRPKQNMDTLSGRFLISFYLYCLLRTTLEYSEYCTSKLYNLLVL